MFALTEQERVIMLCVLRRLSEGKIRTVHCNWTVSLNPQTLNQLVVDCVCKETLYTLR